MEIYLLITGVVILACVLLNRVSSKLGIPMLLAFILLGMFFGVDGPVKINFDNFDIAEKISTTALIFIMFYGGFGTKWSEARPVAVKAVLLSSLGVVITAGITGLLIHLALKINLLESLLIGSVIGSTDAASVFSILRSKRLNLKYNTASLLEVESGSNDPFSFMLTIICISLIKGSADAGQLAYAIFAQIVYGGAFGIVIGILSGFILKRIRCISNGFDAALVLAIAILSYAIPTACGGNGFLSTYITGIYLGNINIKNKKTLVNFFDGITGLMQMLLFFLLGLLSSPSKLPAVALPALTIAIFITFIARPIAVFLIMSPFKCKLNQQLVVSFAGLRGAASIVFAVMAVSAVNTSNDIFHIVFFIVLFSILLQGTLIPILAKRVGMIDNSIDVLKTFSDYAEEVPIRYIQFKIPQKHEWAGKKIREILLPPNTILVLILRGESKLVPDGKTVLEADDRLVLSAKAPAKIEGVHLTEKKIGKDDKWENKLISEIPKDKDSLIVMIKRNNKVVIPKGSTLIKSGDILVINHLES